MTTIVLGCLLLLMYWLNSPVLHIWMLIECSLLHPFVSLHYLSVFLNRIVFRLNKDDVAACCPHSTGCCKHNKIHHKGMDRVAPEEHMCAAATSRNMSSTTTTTP
ncbi:hypothetical protein AMECASPLE_033159 [Ameca splendens]|uniref:Secreted protein n=1 Tax=Ameca splendens TaxID=208324 RepID=A0ABV0ZI19_9TELE